MTYILGLHFGHDSSISVVKDGKLLCCVEVERINKIKHTIGINHDHIKLVLDDLKICISDINYCAITSTQSVEYYLSDKSNLDIIFTDKTHNLPCTLVDKLSLGKEAFVASGNGFVKNLDSHSRHPYHDFFPDYKEKCKNKENFLGGFEKFSYVPLWDKVRSLADIKKTDYSALLANDDLRYGFHYPLIVKIFGVEIPGFVFSHHYAHAAYSFYQSGFSEAALFSHDGGDGNFWSGMFCYGKSNKVYPLTPNYSHIGALYDEAAVFVGFASGGPGKLMGLAPYGKPVFFDSSFVGNRYDLKDEKWNWRVWIDHCLEKAKEMNYDFTNISKKEFVLDPINADIAASTQKLAEEIILEETRAFNEMLIKSEINTKNLCYSGGVALNCPANSRIIKESEFDNVFIGPAVIDAGLSIGAALALYHNLMDCDRVIKEPGYEEAYLGLHSSSDYQEIKKALSEKSAEIEFEEYEDEKLVAKAAARLLQDNKVLGWFYGRSEIGPRALGHRSILANPKYKQNWERVNKIKTRELWRPFAPIVLEERHNDFFESITKESRYMLINAQVRSNELPAITHVDLSSRVQSVNKECGLVYDLLKEIELLSEIPVLLNTSFNGPGEPVIETAKEAIAFLLRTDLDYLVFPKFLVRKK